MIQFFAPYADRESVTVEVEVFEDTRARLLELVSADFEFIRGSPLPLGSTVLR
jgi:hypothetical protein